MAREFQGPWAGIEHHSLGQAKGEIRVTKDLEENHIIVTLTGCVFFSLLIHCNQEVGR